jgi:hypothetical protein
MPIEDEPSARHNPTAVPTDNFVTPPSEPKADGLAIRQRTRVDRLGSPDPAPFLVASNAERTDKCPLVGGK